MIEGNEFEGYTLTCDNCEEGPEEQYNYFMEAVQYKKDNGWKSIKDKNGDWIELCPECCTGDIIAGFRGFDTDSDIMRKAKADAKRLADIASQDLSEF